MTPAGLRNSPEPEWTPLTDAELIDAPQEVARILAARNAEPDTVSLEDEQRRIDPYYDRLFAFQERVIVSPAETLRGCVSKLKVIFDADNGPCATAIKDREFAAVAQVVAVIERAILPPPDNADAALFAVDQRMADLRAERELVPLDAEEDHDRINCQLIELNDATLKTPVKTLADAACILRRLLDPGMGVGPDGESSGLHVVAVQHVLAVVERAAAKGGAS